MTQDGKAIAETLFIGGGAMGALMRSYDWSKTPFGPVGQWPQSLRSTLSICLNSRFPIAIYWGPDCLLLYNDAWRPIVGDKHPWSLGRPGREVWPEIWDSIGPEFASVLTTGEGVFHSDELLAMHRFGYTEECFFDYTFNPIQGEGGAIDGIFNVVSETTYRVLNDRRAQLLREVASRTGIARTVQEACTLMAEALQLDPADIPFSLLYLIDPDENYACLCSDTAGLESALLDRAVAPAWIDLADTDEPLGWPIASVARTAQPQVINDLETRFASLPGSPWPEPLQEAMVLPIAATGQTKVAGVLVAAASPRRKLDDRYCDFLTQVAGQIATTIANARSYEEERRRAEQLAELDRAKTIFFSNVSHEFRTPLTLILGPLEEALQETPEPEQRDRLELIHRNALRLQKLVNTLLDFSRIESGRIEAAYEPTDLARLTADLAGVFRSEIERVGMRLVVDCPSLPEPAYVDRDMWEKIVLNLLSNAFKFTLEGEIGVSLRDRQTHIELEVRDTGTGIPANELSHIFERFHRVQGARGRTYEGSGIGLALVQELVRLHGGTIQVSSVVDQGTRFTVSIPAGYAHLPSDRINPTRTLASTATGATPYLDEVLRWLPGEDTETWRVGDLGSQGDAKTSGPGSTETALPTLSASPRLPLSVSSSTARVLLVDDNADMRDYVRRLLSQQYDVEAVRDGLAALAAIRQRRPDLVLTDVMMPELDGFELLRSLRTDPHTQELPIILLSARAGEESRIEGLAAGADDYLIKPFSARELLARVEATLKMAQLRQEAAQRERAARAEAERANRLKDEFLAIVSHELRSPLNPILGWSTLLQTQKLDPDKTAHALNTIARNAKLQAELIEDLLDLSRILRGKLTLNVSPINLAVIIQAAIETVRLAAAAKSIQIRTQLEPAGDVSGDPSRLQQVVWNLLSNAVKFTPEGGQVDIHLQRLANYAQITVTDTGKGIHPEFLPYVFDYFRQEDGATTRKFGGLGLGLAIVHHLVELHGGTVAAKSPGEGQGSTFTVRLPLIADGPQTNWESQPIEPALDLTGIQALVVDDDADSRAFIAFLVEQQGARAVTAASADEAIAAVIHCQPDVLLSDIGMPDVDGYMMMRQVRTLPPEQGGQIPAIALTAYAGEANYQQAMSAGFQAHISKPVEPAVLIDAIARLVRSLPLSE